MKSKTSKRTNSIVVVENNICPHKHEKRTATQNWEMNNKRSEISFGNSKGKIQLHLSPVRSESLGDKK